MATKNKIISVTDNVRG